MKKKVKLFTTIASLCLAVALMAFGVYAATTASLNVTSSVAFTSTTVLIDVEGKVEGYATLAEDGKATYTHASDNTQVTAYNDTWAIGAMTFDEAHAEITYTVKITNKSEFAIAVTLHDAKTDTAALSYTETGRADFAEIASGVSATYTLKVKLLKFDTSVVATDVKLSFAAAKKA